MKRFLAMMFVFTITSTTGVFGASNSIRINGTRLSNKYIKCFYKITCNSINNNSNINCNVSNNTNNNSNNNASNNANNNSNNGVSNNTSNNSNSSASNNANNNSNNGVSNNTSNNSNSSASNNANNNSNNGVSNNTNNNINSNSVLAIEKEVVELVNKERAKYGLSPLQLDTKVSEVARIKSQDMVSKNYFNHTSPTYGTPFNMLKSFNVSYKTAGENIAKGQKTAAAVVNAWMNSEGHRANILNSKYTHIGVGYAVSGSTPYWTQMFISK